ncbi:hypothetical protein O181_009947 [Austropuccinia psidii MF-1]|uniref:Short-chain dehydrogenase/reductase 3 n=1 Tax=Austropuccinia psidii MF-1 TaxID=1389203 RepID=A0A9Q3GKR6_9BASI|nr:hypothetical protein [Austropuccinia psidii MF-1]
MSNFFDEIKNNLSLLNIDIIYKVTERTFLSPFFTFWIPLIAICQNSFKFLKFSLILFIFVSLRSILIWSSKSWTNKRWNRGQIDWSDQIVIITGGSNGLGRILAETLAIKNISVIVLDIQPFSESQDDEQVKFYYCDISNPNQVDQVAERIRQEIGSPTILVNNAGIVNGKLIIDLEPKDIQKTFGVNFFAHFYLLKAFLPEMIKRNSGHVVTISSVLSGIGIPQLSDYGASKAAASHLHYCLRQELKSKYNADGIRTTLVCPGFMQTKMFEKAEFFNKFFFPPISPHDVMKRIIRSIDNEESEEIFIPFFTNFGPLFHVILPSWFQNFLEWSVGSNSAMKDVNRQPK